MTAEGLASITNRKWVRLQWLDLSYNKIGDEGICHLQAFPYLQALFLFGCGISGKGVQFLSQLEFPDLNVLGLGKNVDN